MFYIDVLSREGLSLFSPGAGWRNVSLKYFVKKWFKLPVSIENDMRASIRKGERSLVLEMVKGGIVAIRPRHIYAAAEESDVHSVRIFHNAAVYIGIGTANIINVLNPQLVLIGRGIVKGRKFMVNTVGRLSKTELWQTVISLLVLNFVRRAGKML